MTDHTRLYWLAGMIVSLIMTTSVERLAAQDAVMGGDDARTGQIEKLELPEAPVVLWKFAPKAGQSGVPMIGGLVAAGSRVLTSDGNGYLYALRAENGSPHWLRLDGEPRCEAPLVMADVAYYASSSGVWGLSIDKSEILWHFEMSLGANESSPLIVGEMLVVTGYDGLMHGLDSQSGEEAWSLDLVQDAPPDQPGFDGKQARFENKPARPGVAASDGETIFQPIFDQSRLVAVDGRTGQLRWSFVAKGWIHAHPVVHRERVYIGSQDRKFYALDKATGKPVWTFQANSRLEAGAAAAGTSVYVGACDGQFYCLHADTGAVQWQVRLDPDSKGKPCPIYAAPLITADTLFVAGMEGQVYAFEPATGKLRWKMRPSADSEIDGNLATDGQRIFVTTRPDNGKGERALIAIGRKP